MALEGRWKALNTPRVTVADTGSLRGEFNALPRFRGGRCEEDSGCKRVNTPAFRKYNPLRTIPCGGDDSYLGVLLGTTLSFVVVLTLSRSFYPCGVRSTLMVFVLPYKRYFYPNGTLSMAICLPC